jgi:formamidopyrimidine-DNA glycosylase
VPELPEVETVRRDLEREVVGRWFATVTVTGRRTVRRQDPAELVGRVGGVHVVRAGRRGKYLELGLDSGDRLVVHLRMSGQLRLHGPDDPQAPHTHAVLGLDDGREVRFVDPRTFGELFVVAPDDEAVLAPSLATIGPDPFADTITARSFAALLARRRQPLKGFLMDSRNLAGIGNIYSDEILFAAGLRHDRPADSLDGRERGRLLRATGEVLAAAVEARGSSLADAQYVDLYGRTGTYQLQHRVYAREGQPCVRCGRPVVRARFQQRSTFSCSRCQA